jgi:arsenate reductase-like glutaredoxin family protein
MKALKWVIFVLLFWQHSFAQQTDKKQLVLYGSAQCYHCVETKNWLNKHQISFVFFDVDEDVAHLKAMIQLLQKNQISTKNLRLPVVQTKQEVFTNEEDFDRFLQKILQKVKE